MASNVTTHDAPNPSGAAAPLAARILHLPITSDAEAFGRVARDSERVLVRLTEPGARHRRSLARFVVDGIEAELERRGAAPRGYSSNDTLEEVVRDQLYRARLLGSFGVAVSFAPLTALADPGDRLSPEDSETLRRLLALAEREPLQLYLPRLSAVLMVAGAPQPLSTWLPRSSEPGRVATIEYDPTSNGEASGSDATRVETSTDGVLVPPPVEAFVDAPRVEAFAAERPAEALTDAPPAAAFAAERPAEALTDAPPAAAWAEPPATAWATQDDGQGLASASDAPYAPEAAAAAHEPTRDATCSAPAANEPEPSVDLAELDAVPLETPVAPPVVQKSDAERAERCLGWAAQLLAMSGPKSHGSVEKAFVGAYLPLRRELAAGGAPEPTREAAERWAEGFAQSYAAAFRQLGSSGRRPRMVRDIVEIGTRWLCHHHARQCQLLLISGMRFDLGQRLNEELERRLANRAVCAEQTLLWTALPSNAEAQQLGEALGLATRRGRPDPAQRAAAAEIESGYVGSRELFRLRQLPLELASAGEAEDARLQRLAAELADTLMPWILRQPPETLIVLFGDHGFHWEADALGTSAAQRGGALPEQVLVPASGWLLREPRTRPKTAPGLH